MTTEAVVYNPEYIKIKYGGLKPECIPETFFDHRRKGIITYKYVNTCKAGMMFGQLGIIYQRARAATCICLQEAEFGYMGKDAFERCFGAIQKISEKSKTQFMEQYVLRNEKLFFFSRKLGIMFKKIKYRQGSLLQIQNQRIKTFYIILRGRVLYRQKIRHLKEGSIIELPIKKSSDIFRIKEFLQGERGHIIGEEGLLDNIKSQYSVVALTNMEVYQITIKKLRDVCKESEGVQKQLF